jgi:hypothetical protein
LTIIVKNLMLPGWFADGVHTCLFQWWEARLV